MGTKFPNVIIRPRARWFLVVSAVAVLCGLAAPAVAGPALPRVEGPDVPTAGAPIAVVAFTDEVWNCSESMRHATIGVPAAYDRVVLEFSYDARTDPWDRLFAVTVGGAEALRGTTPRTDFTITKDITELGSLLPPGGTADIGLSVGSYVGEVSASVRLLFYADEPTAALVAPPADNVVAPFAVAGLDGNGDRLTSTAAFPAGAPSAANVELTLTGHGGEEFWYVGTNPVPRAFDVIVDGRVVATATALPYVYALLGFGNANANTACVGPGSSSTGDTVHPVMWWTVPRVLDAAGVHLGIGEIPPYRASITADDLALLAGDRTVEVVQRGGGGRWVTGLTFLLND